MMGGNACPSSSIEFRASLLREITALLYFADLSSGFLPFPNLLVTYSLREYLRAFIDLL